MMPQPTHETLRRPLSPRLPVLLLGATLALAACSSDSSNDGGATGPQDRTPDEVVRGAIAVGERTTLVATVSTATYTTRTGGDQGLGFLADDDRYVLLALGDTEGLNEAQKQWGVGAHFPADKLASREWALPQAGDRIRVTGTVAQRQLGGFGEEQRFLIDPVESWETLDAILDPPLVDIGGACFHDTECMDDLLCGRPSLRCERPPEGVGWGSAFRNINGACDTDDDCPNGQRCDRGYRIKGEGPYRTPYQGDRDEGRFLCQLPDREAPLKDLCPRFVTPSDVASGRYPYGKEVCIEGTILIAIFNPGDRDTHVQYVVPDGLNYPLGLPPINLFGLAAENTPPYKDPDNPAGAIGDPLTGQRTVHIGTVRFDPNHNWQEVHPIKVVRLRPPLDQPPQVDPEVAAELAEMKDWPGIPVGRDTN